MAPMVANGQPPAKKAKTDTKPGDWICPSCGDLQFARNHVCRVCSGQAGSTMPPALAGHENAKPGDWVCPACGDLQFARNSTCRMCYGAGKAKGKGFAGKATPKLPEGSTETAKPGDWICPTCGDLQFARNASCRVCAGFTGEKAKGKGCMGMGMGMMSFGGAGAGGQPGDWTCPMCGDHQFARNTSCRMCGFGGKGCKGGGMMGMKGGCMMGMKGGGKKQEMHGDPELLVYVGNLTYEVKWQDLKDHMKQAGDVEFCKILTEDGTEWGRSKGAGCVRYKNSEEVQVAISTLAETELQGRKILVDRWGSK